MAPIAPRRFINAAGSLLGIWAALASFRPATVSGLTTDVDFACPEQGLACFADDDCSTCLTNLDGIDTDFEFDECPELYDTVSLQSAPAIWNHVGSGSGRNRRKKFDYRLYMRATKFEQPTRPRFIENDPGL